MKRREFIALAGCAAVAWPRAAGAQQTKLPTIGVLSVANPAAWAPSLNAFVAQLGELGWIDGRTVAIEYRWADGRSERFAELAAELVRLKVDVIVTAGAAVAAAKQATTIIPIVFAVASDPLATGLIASLAHPGSNVTGLSVQAADVAGKRVELLRELFPGGRTLAIMANLGYVAAEREMSEVQAAARSVGFETTMLEIRSAQDIAGSIDKLKPGADLLYVCIDPITDTNQILIATSTLAARIPTMPGIQSRPLKRSARPSDGQAGSDDRRGDEGLYAPQRDRSRHLLRFGRDASGIGAGWTSGLRAGDRSRVRRCGGPAVAGILWPGRPACRIWPHL
jgi:putative tryptophan/tyrosine transport system substrate-binding protein